MSLNSAPNLQVTAGAGFGDGLFQLSDHVTITGVSNLPEGLRGVIKAYDPDAKLYVVKDANGSVWGLKPEKLKAMQSFSIEQIGFEWVDVPDGVVIPAGLEISMNMETGGRKVRRMHERPKVGDQPN